MSSPLQLPSDQNLVDPSQVNLVDSIIRKTREKKLYWNKAKPGFVAVIPVTGQPSLVPMRLEFHCTPSIAPSFPQGWQHFVVTTNEGIVLRADNSMISGVIAKLAGAGSNPLLERIDQLFALVTQVGEGSLERAKNVIDRL
jgi:hypothetical protein